MSKKILIPGLIIIGILLGMTAGSFLQHPEKRYGKGHKKSRGKIQDFMMHRMFKELKLTEDQKKIVNKIRDEIKSKIEALKGDKKEKEAVRSEIIKQIKQNNINKTAIMNIIKTKKAKKSEIENFMIEKLIKFHSILTPQQREELAKRIAKFGYKGKKHSGRKGHGGRRK